MLKYLRLLICVVLLITCSFGLAQRSTNKLVVTERIIAHAFPFLSNTTPVIYIDANDAKVVQISAEAFVKDVQLISGKKLPIKSNPVITDELAVVAGTIGHSVLIDELIAKKKISVDSIKGGWEQFSITVINQPYQGAKKLLVIAGIDSRGTAFGIFHLSKLMGVSPWVWWADVMPQKKQQLFVSGSYNSKEPSVKYRGIFINDEDWGLQPWAAKTFEPETGDIGPKTYAKVFELLLRLKANLIWPAMHECTKPFFTIPGNAKIAEDYAIIIGSSHAEPMLRSNTGEWDVKKMGNFNYVTNKDSVYKYWEDRVKESSGINAMYSIGMRGVHDSKMEGVKDAKEAVPLLHTIFKDQRDLLRKYINKDITKVPQIFTAYKEVLEIYDHDLQLPEDITLVWPDDNYGYIQRLNNDTEKKRPGGSGVYYHASYWGRPHDYLWLSSTHPSLIQEEMMKAYDNGSNRLWVLNVGDIKPLEYNTELFLNMAYDALPFRDNSYAKKHLLQWSTNIFGKERGQTIKNVLWQYYQLAFERRPEFMGWSQTEPTTKTNYTVYNHFYYGDEAQKRIDSYEFLQGKVVGLRKQIKQKDADAFFQLVYYPVMGAALINKKFLYRDKSFYYAKQNRLNALDYAQQSKAVYDSIVSETNFYNNKLSGGKWKNIMSMKPRDLPVFQEPAITAINIKDEQGWSISCEGTMPDTAAIAQQNNEAFSLPSFDNLNQQQYFIDVFLTDKKATTWTATVSAPWIKLSINKAELLPVNGRNQARLFVSVDWQKIPVKNLQEGMINFAANGKTISVKINANRLSFPSQANSKSFIEKNGYVSIHAGNYNRKVKRNSGEWLVLPGLGYAGTVLQAQAVSVKDTAWLRDTSWIKTNSAVAEYDFYTFSEGNAMLTVFTVPTHPLNNNFSMRYAVSVDNGPLQIIDFKTVGRTEEWKQNVLKNRVEKKISLSFVKKGAHHLKLYCVDPGVLLDAMLIDLGGMKTANGLIAETKIK